MQAQSWAAFAAFVLLITVASPARADQDVLARARLQTFVVEVCPGPGIPAAIGSGVVVGRSGDTLTIATAAHILRQRGALRILDASRQAFYDVLDVQLLDDYDLGLVRVRAQNAFPVAPASFAPALPGEPVWVWGHTGGGFWQIAAGSVLAANAPIPGVPGSPRITIACAACTHGDSGAGVFDTQGRLLGILTRAWSEKSGGAVLFIEVEPAALISRNVLADR